jgi:CheY-like chemotaxis protein
MSHEIRTPLNGIIGNVDLLDGPNLTCEQKESLGTIRECGTSLLELIDDVLDFSRLESGTFTLERREFELGTVIESAVDIVSVKARTKGLGLTALYPRALIFGDEARLRQVLVNLCGNAVKFTHEGQIEIDVACASEANGRDWVEITVRDSGIGFDGADADRIFGRFEQVHSSTSQPYGGTGLGLAICRSLVAMMGGKISATSAAGIGSRFLVRLPLPRVEVAAPVRMEPAADAAFEGLRVLLAEDNAINRRVVALMLEPIGARIAFVEDGRAAVEAAAAAAEPYDVILMDLRMPVMDGLEATRAIRARQETAHTPILMLSADALPEHVAQSLAAGCNAHVAKPLTPARLFAALAEHLPRAAA